MKMGGFIPCLVLLMLSPGIIGWGVISGKGKETQSGKIFLVNIYDKASWDVSESEDGSKIFQAEKTGGFLLLICIAPFPVKWSVNGIIVPMDVFGILPPERLKDKWTIKATFHYNHYKSIRQLMTSAEVRCEKVGESRIVNSLKIFVVGYKSSLQPWDEKEDIVLNSKKIPCITTNHTEPVKLFKGQLNITEDFRYNPIQGFTSDEFFNGHFACKQGTSFVVYTAKITGLKDLGLEYSPKSSKLDAFTDEMINFECSSKDNRTNLVVGLQLRKDENVSRLTGVPSANYTFTRFSLEALTPMVMDKAVCCLNEGSTKFNLHQVSNTSLKEGHKNKLILNTRQEKCKMWEYMFFDPPTFIMTGTKNGSYEGTFRCKTDYFFLKYVAVFECESGLDCELRRVCIESDNCKLLIRGFTVAEKNQHFASVQHSNRNGLAFCKLENGPYRIWEYFLSLDGNTYINWNDAPVNELVRMEEVHPFLYVNQTNLFICTALSFLFTAKVEFEVVFENGTSVELNHNNSTCNITYAREEEDDGFNVVGLVNALLPVEAVKVDCIALWWNSSDVMRASVEFEMRYTRAPTFDNETGVGAVKTFYSGSNHSMLVCAGSGEPQPRYKWLYKMDGEFKNVSEVFPELVVGLGESGESYLAFPEMFKNYSGEYKCIAQNTFGEAQAFFVVDILDMPAMPWWIVFKRNILLCSVSLILLATVVLCFYLPRNLAINKET